VARPPLKWNLNDGARRRIQVDLLQPARLFIERVLVTTSRWHQKKFRLIRTPEAEAELVAGYNVEYGRDVILNSSLLAKNHVPTLQGCHQKKA
jgi:hypothetical protein